MTIPSSPAPPTGSVGVGQLLADAQNRTLWLGVPSSIDAHQSVLISDLIGLQQGDVDTLAAANSHADTGLAGKAATVHTHAIADVTGLTAALAAAASSLPTGCIVLWSGLLANIPGGWHLCDGSAGTPDLRDRFVLGAGGSTGNALDIGGSKNRIVTSQLGGAHTPTGNTAGTVLTTAQLPAHNHTITDPGHIHTIVDPGHTHDMQSRVIIPSAGNNFKAPAEASPTGTMTGAVLSATTGVTVASGTTGISVANAGSDQPHTHALAANAVAAHTHDVSFDVMGPYIILGYIMKV